MGRNFDPIDIIFIVLIGTYLISLFLIVYFLKKEKQEKVLKLPKLKEVTVEKKENIFQHFISILKQKSIVITTERIKKKEPEPIVIEPEVETKPEPKPVKESKVTKKKPATKKKATSKKKTTTKKKSTTKKTAAKKTTTKKSTGKKSPSKKTTTKKKSN